MIDERAHGGTHAHGFDGEELGCHFEHARVADLDELRAGGDDALALAQHAQDLAGSRRQDLELIEPTRASALQRRARLGQLMVGDLGAEGRGREILRARRGVGFRHLEITLRDRGGGRELSFARQIVAGARVGDLRAGHVRGRLRDHRFARLQARFLFRARTWIEQRRVVGNEPGQDRAFRDVVACLELDA